MTAVGNDKVKVHKVKVDKVKVHTVTLDPQPAMVIRRKVATENLGTVLGDILPRVYQHIIEAGQQPAGMPFMRYFSMDGASCDIAAGMPVAEPIAATGEIENHTLPGGEALTALHVGAYEDVGQVWGQVMRRAGELGSEKSFGGWDQYTNDPGEVEPHELETRVYLPL